MSVNTDMRVKKSTVSEIIKTQTEFHKNSVDCYKIIVQKQNKKYVNLKNM